MRVPEGVGSPWEQPDNKTTSDLTESDSTYTLVHLNYLQQNVIEKEIQDVKSITSSARRICVRFVSASLRVDQHRLTAIAGDSPYLS